MARVKTVWTVTGPITDPHSGEIINTTVMQGSVTGDRLTVAREHVTAAIRQMAKQTNAKEQDYALTIAIGADDIKYFRLVSDSTAGGV